MNAKSSTTRGALLWLTVAWLAAAAPIRGDQTPAAGTLHWSNGDQLPGRLVGGSADGIRWQSPVLGDAPFTVDLNYLNAVHFDAAAESRKSDDPMQFVTNDGDVLFGRLVDVTAEHVVIESGRHGRVTLLRASVQGLALRDNPTSVDLSSAGTEGWRTLRRAGRVSGWTTNQQGQLTTRVIGAELFRDLKLPAVAEIDIVLSWLRRPGFVITFASPEAILAARESVKLETWEDELVLQTLASNNDFQQLKTLDDRTKTIHLRLLWNQQARSLAVYARNGKLLGKMAAGGAAVDREDVGLYIKNKGSDLTLVQLRVSHWSGVVPDDEGQNYVRLTNGDILHGRVGVLDKQARALVIADARGNERRVPLPELSSVYFGDDQRRKAAAAPVRLSFSDGTQLQGQLESVTGTNITLKTAFTVDHLVARLDGARELTFAGDDRGLPAASHRLELGGAAVLHGAPAPADPPAVLGWQPRGSRDVCPLPVDQTARIVTTSKSDGAPAGAEELTDVVYLRNGDVMPCRVDVIGETHLLIDTFFGAAKRIPHEKVKAVELSSEGHVSFSGFRDASWAVNETRPGIVERKREQVVFHDSATMRHESLQWGDQIECQMQWHASQRSALTIQLLAEDNRASSGCGVLLYFLGNQLFVRGVQAGGQQLNAFVRPKVGGTSAKLSIIRKDDQLHVQIDGRSVFTQHLNDRIRPRVGIQLSLQRMGNVRNANPNAQADGLVTLSNFRVGKSVGPPAIAHVDEEEREYLLTVPRHRKHNPPTHMLVARNGDLLRGRLVALTDEDVRFTSRLDDLSIPRERVAGIVWLDDAEDEEPASGGNLRAIFHSGITVTMAAEKTLPDRIVGTHPVLGACGIPLASLSELQIGQFAANTQSNHYSHWKLRPAKEPQFAGAAAGNSADGAPFGTDSPLVGQPAKDFTVPLLDGGSFRLAAHSDKIVILDFWATWCGPCVKATPEVIQVAKAFPQEKVLLVAVNVQENSKTIRDFLGQRGWQVAVALDRDGRVSRQFQVQAIPQTVVVGRGGKIQRLHVGAHPKLKDELHDALQQLLADDAPAADDPPPEAAP